MKNILISVTLLSALSISTLNIVYAGQISDQDVKTYTLRVTSKDPNKAIPFNGSFMTVFDKNSVITNIARVTPFEIPIKASFFSTMIQVSDRYPVIKVEIIEKNDNGDEPLLSGTGHSIATHNGSNTGTFIFAK